MNDKNFREKIRKYIMGETEGSEVENIIREKLRNGEEVDYFTKYELVFIKENPLRIRKIIKNETPSGIYYLIYNGDKGDNYRQKLAKKMGIYPNGISYWIERLTNMNLLKKIHSSSRRKKFYKVNETIYPNLTLEILRLILREHGEEKIKELTNINKNPRNTGIWFESELNDGFRF